MIVMEARYPGFSFIPDGDVWFRQKFLSIYPAREFFEVVEMLEGREGGQLRLPSFPFPFLIPPLHPSTLKEPKPKPKTKTRKHLSRW